MGLKITRIDLDDKVVQSNRLTGGPSRNIFTEAALASLACDALVRSIVDDLDEHALLLCPLREGPIAALKTMNTLIDGHRFDHIKPTYVSEEANTPRAKEWLEETVGKDFNIDQCTPISGLYDGGSGEMFAACTRALSGTKNTVPFISANVLLRVSSFTELSVTLDDFFDHNNAIVGYVADARDESLYDNGMGFPRNVRIDIPSELDSISKVLRGLLDGEYNTSPLRSVEVVRAIMLYHISRAETGIDALKLWKKLDIIYNHLADKEKVRFSDRNEINRSLRSQLSIAGIINTTFERNKRVIISRGDAWGTYGPLLSAYLEFAKDAHK